MIEDARIIENRRLAPRYFRMRLSCPEVARLAQPGQFVMLKVSATGAPLLRRPLGVHRVQAGAFELLYETVGPGTRLLSRMRPGEPVDVLGPLGNGFDLAAMRQAGKRVLVAGGMGVAPLLFLAESLSAEKRRGTRGEDLILIGAKTATGVLCLKEFRAAGFRVQVATDDGSRGKKGYVSSLLPEALTASAHVCACGPRPMLREVSRIVSLRGVRAQVSLEEHMACGIGACLGCAVRTTAGYARVCKDGPVFDAGSIVWEKE